MSSPRRRTIWGDPKRWRVFEDSTHPTKTSRPATLCGHLQRGGSGRPQPPQDRKLLVSVRFRSTDLQVVEFGSGWHAHPGRVPRPPRRDTPRMGVPPRPEHEPSHMKVNRLEDSPRRSSPEGAHPPGRWQSRSFGAIDPPPQPSPARGEGVKRFPVGGIPTRHRSPIRSRRGRVEMLPVTGIPTRCRSPIRSRRGRVKMSRGAGIPTPSPLAEEGWGGGAVAGWKHDAIVLSLPPEVSRRGPRSGIPIR